jgi:hypothetical protein
MLLLLALVPLALAVLTSRLLFRRTSEWQRRDDSRARAATEAALAATGLRVEGDVLGFHVARLLEDGGVEVTRDGVARVAAPLLDQIVCKVSEIDEVMGPLPAVPRVRTGHAPFDAEYAIFVGVSGGGSAGSYRAAPTGGDTPWARPPILDALQRLGLQRMRIREGQAELTFVPALPIEAAGRAARLALAVERAARGMPLPSLAPLPTVLLPPRPSLDVEAAFVWLAAAFAGLLGGVLLGSLAEGDADPGPSPLVEALHYAGSAVLGTSLALLLACAIMLRRLMKHSLALGD